jgi:uncharacterized damage-inducible protein DinB
LDRIPDDKLTWRPHAKSMSIGQLGLHIAQVPHIAQMAQADEMPVPEFGTPEQPTSKKAILAKLDEAMANARALLPAMDDAKMASAWRVLKGDREVMNIPKAAVIRAILLNHLYHHRGQLSVYLRLLDIPVPATYGQSADESLFG